MTKFHINKHGVPAPCKAKPGNCPYGGESGFENHFDNLEDAQAAADKENEEEFGYLPTQDAPSSEEIKEIRKAKERVSAIKDEIGADKAIEKLSEVIDEKKLDNIAYNINYDLGLEFSIDKYEKGSTQIPKIVDRMGAEGIFNEMIGQVDYKNLNSFADKIELEQKESQEALIKNKIRAKERVNALKNKMDADEMIERLSGVVEESKLDNIAYNINYDLGLEFFIDKYEKGSTQIPKIVDRMGAKGILNEMIDNIHYKDLDKFVDEIESKEI